MPEITVYESERGYIERFLRYDPAWSASAKRNTPVLKTDLASPGVFFFVKTKDSDASAITGLDLNDTLSAEIEWLDETNGQILIKLGAFTNGNAADSNVYELRIKLSDNTYVTLEKGTMNILESTVDEV